MGYTRYTKEPHPLVGQRIKSVTVTNDRQTITFELADGREVVGVTDADCCSYTWIENVEGVENLIGREVVAVEDIDMPDLGNVPTPWWPDVDVVAYYGTKITSDIGTCVIDFRNDSNGYYGGALDWKVSRKEPTPKKDEKRMWFVKECREELMRHLEQRGVEVSGLEGEIENALENMLLEWEKREGL